VGPARRHMRPVVRGDASRPATATHAARHARMRALKWLIRRPIAASPSCPRRRRSEDRRQAVRTRGSTAAARATIGPRSADRRRSNAGPVDGRTIDQTRDRAIVRSRARIAAVVCAFSAATCPRRHAVATATPPVWTHRSPRSPASARHARTSRESALARRRRSTSPGRQRRPDTGITRPSRSPSRPRRRSRRWPRRRSERSAGYRPGPAAFRTPDRPRPLASGG